MPVRTTPFHAAVEDEPRRPYLRVEYVNPHNDESVKVYALIDTGADDCVLPARFADILGHDLKKGKPYSVASASGFSRGYLHTTRITIPGFATEECLIGFLPGLNTPLLGVRSFLNHFRLMINYPKLTFSLRNPEIRIQGDA